MVGLDENRYSLARQQTASVTALKILLTFSSHRADSAENQAQHLIV